MRQPGAKTLAFGASVVALLAALYASAGPQAVLPVPAPAVRRAHTHSTSVSSSSSKPPPLVNADDELASFLAQAEELIERKAWNRAIDIIQALIVRPDSGFVPAPDGKQYISLWYQANELVGRMGPEGLKLYRRRFNPPAQQMYEKAVSAGDEKLLRRVVQRYLWSDYGIRSLEALGTLHFDHGRFHQAARFWRRALRMRRGSKGEPLLLAKIAAAYHLCGKADQAKALADELKKKHPSAEAALGGKSENLVAFVQRVMKLKCSVPQWRRRQVAGWPGMGGIPDGLAVMADSEVVLAPRWRQPDVSEKATTALTTGELIAGKSAFSAYQQRFRMTLRLQKGHVYLTARRSGSSSSSRTALASFRLPPLLHPVVVGDTVIWRQDDDVWAYDVFTGEFKWRSRNLPFESVPSSSASRSSSHYYSYVKMGECGHYTLTVGGGKVFAVYHYSLPKRYRPTGWINPRMGGPQGADRSAIAALLLKGEGKLAWKVGNGQGDHEIVRNGKFLTAPTYHDGRLYVTAVYLQGYYLLCLDADTGSHIWSAMIAQTPAISSRSRYPMGYVFYRGSPPAVADGTVFALTNSGALAAFEAETGRALWAYQYESKVNSPTGLRYGMSNSHGVYKPPNPMIAARGRVVCMPADSSSVFALAIEDGHLLWSVDRGNQHDLSAIDADRILLSGPGLMVLSAENGGELYRADDKGINGRPAVTDKAVLASGQDAILRLDLSDYSKLTRLGLSGSQGLLGSLVSMKGKLIVANAAGVCAYFDYEHARSALADRIKKAPAEDRWRLLFQQAQLAFNAKCFQDALDGLEECAAGTSGDRLKRLKLAPWFYRTYVALGNRATELPKMLALFRKAEPYAATDRDKAHLKIRVAKYHEKVGEHVKAVSLAQSVGQDHAQLKIADVQIGQDADDTLRLGPESESLTGNLWARQFVAGLIRRHGRSVYTEQDAKAQLAFKRAKNKEDPEALLLVAQNWPNSKWADGALFAAAEACYLRAAGKNTAEADRWLQKAVKHLSVVADDDDSRLRVSANIGLAIIYAGGDWGMAAAQSLNQIRDEPKDTPVSFAGIKGSLGDLVRDISGGNLPMFQARMSLASVVNPPLRKIFSLTGQDVYVLRDQEYRPIRLGQRILVLKRDALKGNRAVFLDTSASKATGEGQWTGLAPTDPSMSQYMYAPGYGLVSGLSRDNKVLVIASRTNLRGLLTENAKVVWNKSMADVGIGSFACMGTGAGVLVAVDSQGRLSCVDIATGSVKWKAKLVGATPRPSGPPKIAAGRVFVRHNSFRTLVCLNAENGKIIGKWDAKRYLSVYPTDEGLVAVMVDDELSVLDVGKLDKPLWFRRYGPSTYASILAISSDKIVVSPNQATSEVKVLSVIGRGRTIATFQATKIGAARAVPIDARLTGDAVYVICSTTTSGRRKTMYGRLSTTRGLCIQKFDLVDKKPAPLWSRQLEVPRQSNGYLMPLVVGQKHLVVCTKYYSTTLPSTAFVVDTVTGQVRHRFELVERGVAGAAAQYRRLRVIGPPVMTNGRLCVEDYQGLTVYGGQ